MKAFQVLVLALLGCTIAFALKNEDPHVLFKQFMHKYSKNYATTQEHNQRFEIFKANLDIAAARNRKDPHARHGVTKFSDITPQEFKSLYLMNVTQPKMWPAAPGGVVNVQRVPNLPDSYDWKDKGMVTAVKDQGQCGSCWDFSATETVESVWALAGNTLTSLSEQQILDCDTVDQGCNGGWPYDAYQYVMQAGGQEPDSDYPYTAQDGTCNFNAGDIDAKLNNWQYVTQSGDETAMQNFLYSNSPLSVCVDAETWQSYTGGVITTDSGCGNSLDHCVQATGWQQMQGMAVWNVRNSWNTNWGDSGYIYIQIGGDVCGISQVVTVPVAA